MKVVSTAIFFTLLVSPAFAGSWETRCETQTVPYQETVKGGKPGEVLGGAVIGGLIGKAATGKDGGAVAGAIIGGAVANETSSHTVTKYKDVETCTQVFVPAHIYDKTTLRDTIQRLNSGERLNKELVMDVQYTIGVTPDGKWGPRSVTASKAYLEGELPAAPLAQPQNSPLYTLMVNEVVVVSSYDLAAIDDIKSGLLRAGVDAKILVDMQ